jgi:hypothetical protein
VNIEASQAGNTTYNTAPPINQTFQVNTVALLPQTITFPAISNKTMSDGPFTLSATASSGLPVSYRVVSGPATVSGNTVTLSGTAGTIIIEASEAGNGTYSAATPITQTFTVSASAPDGDYQPIPGKVEAESFSAMQWVVLENCSEGGQDATAFGPGSYLDYKVNVAAAGTYTMNFRVGGFGGQMQVRDANGVVLKTITVPTSFGWQSWKTISTTLTLPTGKQVLRIYVTEGGFNLNWFEGLSGGALITMSPISGANANNTADGAALTSLTTINLYPLPAKTEMTVQISNNFRGPVRVVLLDEAGRIRKELRLQKQGLQLVQKLSLTELSPGVYLMQFRMNNKTETKTFIKQ